VSAQDTGRQRAAIAINTPADLGCGTCSFRLIVSFLCVRVILAALSALPYPALPCPAFPFLSSPFLPRAGKGRLDEDSGFAHFDVNFLSLVFRPFKNEILLAKVHTITNVSPARSACLPGRRRLACA
jgi:hypothetical protein